VPSLYDGAWEVYFSQSEETAMWSEERHRWRGGMLETTALKLPAGNYRRLTAKSKKKKKEKKKTKQNTI